MDLATLRLQRIVDRLLMPWARGIGPGVTLGVVRDDALVVHRHAGFAHIEPGVPIGRETTFRIASVSKQFTCAGILMLEAEGKLRLDDDVRDHILGFPEFGHRITLDHLMHNTSGIRDMLEIMRLGGMDLGPAPTAQHLLDSVCRQRALNFDPGTRYLYSNSNFMLLGRVIEQVSGEGLGRFLDQRIFTPLGMAMTRHTPTTMELVPGLAAGYLPTGDGWRRALHNFPLHGEGGLVSSVEDLALWHAQFGLPARRGSALGEALTAMEPFPNGHPNTYARGLRIKSHQGVITVGHDGLWPGFKTTFVRIPEHNAAVICISNDGGSDPHDLACQVVDTLIEGAPSVHPVLATPTWATGDIAGCYLDRDTGATIDLGRDAQGRITANANGTSTWLVPTADGRLETSRGSGDLTLWVTGESLELERDAGERATLHHVTPGGALPPDLSGRYANEDTAATWTIAGSELFVSGPLVSAGPWEVAPVEGDALRIYTPITLYRGWLDTRVQRDAAGGVTGLHVDGGRVKGLVFSRLPA